jgi:hypothetical protein
MPPSSDMNVALARAWLIDLGENRGAQSAFGLVIQTAAFLSSYVGTRALT